MGIGRIFPGGAQKIYFQGESNNGEIFFYLIKTRRKIFLAKNLLGKYQIPKSRAGHPAIRFPHP